MNLRTSLSAVHLRARRTPTGLRRSALTLAVAASGAVVACAVTAGTPAAQAGSDPSAGHSTSVARQLGLTASSQKVGDTRSLADLTASRSQRQADQAAAAQSQAAAEQQLQAQADAQAKAQAEAQAQAQAEAQAQAQAQAKAQAEAQAKAEAAAKAAAEAAAKAAAAPPPSFRDYALQKVGAGQFSCLQKLWGKESGWDPNAKNPSSTAYGIPQFLDSTWASTGIAKTSDGYRQIDAGLIYIDQRYGSPCGAWAHSRAYNWY